MPINSISNVPGSHRAPQIGYEEWHLSEPPPIAPILGTLSYFGLTKKTLTYIPAEFFTGCNISDTLSLGGNRLSVVPDVRNLNTTLRRFLSNDNFITCIESLYFMPMINLKTLVLAGKLLTEIKFVKAVWPAITSIALNINFLTTIKLSGLSRVSGKVKVLVRDIPCDAELCWLSRCQ